MQLSDDLKLISITSVEYTNQEIRDLNQHKSDGVGYSIPEKSQSTHDYALIEYRKELFDPYLLFEWSVGCAAEERNDIIMKGKSTIITYHCIYDYNKVCEVTVQGKYDAEERDKLFDALALMDLNQTDEILSKQLAFFLI